MTIDVETHDFGRFAPSDVHLDNEYVCFFGGFRAPDPRPGSGISHTVTHDTLVDGHGDVTIRVNGLPLHRVGKEQGSHIP